MADGNAAARRAAPPSAAASSCRGGRGCGLALGRLVRKLRRQSRMLCAATAGARHAAAAARCCHQYDPLSYARNFDLGTAGLDGDGGCSFASRFVLAPGSRSSRD
ncbi:hypothetical protein ACP70R_043488 [Stipagrostis hirtigluma subsp. patula]